MKSLIASLLISACIPKLSICQTLSSLDTNKYSIHLPDYWKPGNKAWQILSDKLPLVCDELKGKELCGDNCNPKYSIEFEMSEPIIFRTYPSHILTANGKESWNIITDYGFSSSLLLLNEKNELLIKFILVDFNESWTKTRRIEVQSSTPAQPIQPVKVITLNSVYLTQEKQINPGNNGYSQYRGDNMNNYSSPPTRIDMLGIVDQKIKSL
jgi:hypothetical protein